MDRHELIAMIGAWRRRMRGHGVSLLALLALFVAHPARAEADPVVIGASLPLSGAGVIVNGAALRDGLEAAAKQINARGGVGGRMLQVRVLDDGGDPELAAQNTRTLVADPEVVAMAGCLGEAACLAIAKAAAKAGVVFVGPGSGNPVLCGQNGLAYCLRQDYVAEAARICRELHTIGVNRAVVLVGDAFIASKERVIEALGACGIRIDELPPSALGAKDPDLSAYPEGSGFAVFGDTADALAFVSAVRQAQPVAPVAVMSSAHLFEWLQQIRGARGVLVTHGVPDPDLPTLAIVRDYQTAMETFVTAYSHEQFEAFEAVQVIARLLRQTQPIGRTALRTALAGTDELDLGGHVVSLTSSGEARASRVFVSLVSPTGRFMQ
ncbi:ABC transporter substrate-binding protein [Nitrogeniibacter aestuarii]|uniref:ABC transporter substrate-binding protein n=1 Tax=Nitrogeniibacter aestuarii TaxID=2815343 RepID=UPI001D1175B8|nr:ABC transporter substrate-binding protein [Nitrogeniibacter aestuarii]